MAALPCAVHTLFEFEDVPFGDFKTGWRLHVKVLLEVGIEVSRLNIHLVEFQVVLGCECEDSSERGEFHHRGKGLVEINAFNLRKALGDDSSFVFLNRTIRSPLDAEDPFTPNYLAAFRLGDDVIGDRYGRKHTYVSGE
jgi:hypothetical protein